MVNNRFNDRKEHLATKQDIESSKTDFAERIGAVKVDLASMEARLIKWTVGTSITATGIIITAIKLL